MKCRVCGKEHELISSTLKVCKDCIVNEFDSIREEIAEVHRKCREVYSLPYPPPRGGIKCELCSNECSIPPGERGFCGLRENSGGLKSIVSAEVGLLHYYLDPHVTNCCASWFCPGGTSAGYPEYSPVNGPEIGYYNLAVFFYGCNFNCLFCQNHEHKNLEFGKLVSKDQLSSLCREERITCLCYFGGSPEPHLPFSIRLGNEVKDHVRVCFEWNGCGNKSLVRKAGEISFESGGIVKFDLKTFSEELSLALCGVSNRRAYENFETLYHEFYDERKEPFLTATTLLVPGYVDEEEVRNISEFLSSLNPEIPYSLLVFYPQHYMSDLPVTPREQVKRCYEVAKEKLKRVHIGNLHLLL